MKRPHVVLERPPEPHEVEELRALGITWEVAPRQPVVPPRPPRRYSRRRDARLTPAQIDAAWKNPPGRGKPCTLPAIAGSKYCVSHDPARDAERRARLAELRSRIAA